MAIRLNPIRPSRLDQERSYIEGNVDSSTAKKKNKIMQRPIILDFRESTYTRARKPVNE